VESAEDILEELNFTAAPHAPADDSGNSEPQASAAEASLSGLELGLLDSMGFDPCGLDAIQARSGMDTATLQALLMGLELAGWVARLPGGKFQRLGRG
jgi:DNA processing protein